MPNPTTPEKQGEEFANALRAFADAKYVRGCEIARADACLGAEYKLDNGKFGFREFAAHKNFNEHMGAYFAIQEFLKENAHLTAHAQQQAAMFQELQATRDALLEAFKPHSSNQRCMPERFSTGVDGRLINDDDFLYDAQLSVTGDFGNDEARRAFSQALCDVLNVAAALALAAGGGK